MRGKIKQKIKFFITNADEYLCSCMLSFCHGLGLSTLSLSFIAFELLLKGGLVYIYKEKAEDRIDRKLKRYSHDLVKIYKKLYSEYPILKDNGIKLGLRYYCGKIKFKGDIINQSSVYESARYSAGVILISQFKNEVLEPYLFLREKITAIVKDEVGDLPIREGYKQLIRKYNKVIQKDSLVY